MKATVAFTSLGCDKNRVDSEVMLGLLEQDGLQLVADEAEADFIIINTCCFIKDALEESIETILELAQYKKDGKCKGLLVAGCLGQRYAAEIFEEMPEVDAVLGTTAYESVTEAINRLMKGEQGFHLLENIDKEMVEEHGTIRRISTAGYYAYLKISEGCDNHCTYCVIPKLRGKHRSRHMESLVEEATVLAKQGVKELVIVAQDTSIYGRDLYGEAKLGELLTRLCQVDGIEWIRLLYCYPETLTEDTIAVMAKEPKICHYIDMPIQHGCDTVLKRMGRKSSLKMIRGKIEKLREAMPDIAIRTTLIVGFPGETEEEFSQLCDFVEDMKFERLGVFTYSQEDDTPAACMPNQIEEDCKEARKKEIMEIQNNIAARWSEKQVGKKLQVLVEGKLPDEHIYCGRTQWDAPEIDGLVFLSASESLLSGDFVTVEVTEAREYDLIGDMVYGNEFGE